MCLLSARLSCSSSSPPAPHTHTHTTATCFLPPLCHWEVFLKEGAGIKRSRKMPVWRSSDSPASWTLLKEGAEEKRERKIGHILHNLCSVNFPAPASTVYRVLCISNLPLLLTPPPSISLKPQSLLYFILPPLTFLWFMLFGFFFSSSVFFLCH